MAYATVEDVEARTTATYTQEEENVIAALLEDAAVMIDGCNSNASADAKKIVSCRMVIRAFGKDNGAIPVGATQGAMTAGPYTQSWTVSGGGTVGEMYLGKADRQLLGAGDRIGAYSPLEGMVPNA